jgi:hypothetical protein
MVVLGQDVQAPIRKYNSVKAPNAVEGEHEGTCSGGDGDEDNTCDEEDGEDDGDEDEDDEEEDDAGDEEEES